MGLGVSSTVSVKRRRSAQIAPREMVNAWGWKWPMPLRLAGGSAAKGAGEPSRALRIWATSSRSSARSRITRIHTGPPP
jgi:hypothetical protein